jgi:hypothetical protein
MSLQWPQAQGSAAIIRRTQTRGIGEGCRRCIQSVLDTQASPVYRARNAGPKGPALSVIDVSRGFLRKACVKTLSGFEKGSQRRARFLHPEHEVSGVTI